MQTIQLYIEGTRVDMFDDESVSITQTIKNVRDIERVFTSFTKQFTLPASKTNNRLFKHYYNFEIIGGFDARKKVNSTIELNHLPFKKGKLKLDGVEMRNNVAYAYKVIFYGDTVSLRDLIGDDKLSDLEFGSDFDGLKYDASTIETYLTVKNPATSTEDLIVPLITHTQRPEYDSGSTVAGSSNMYYSAGTFQGVRFNELKYAIRLNRIIEAIEDTYSISFSDDFFKDTANTRFFNLFMWLHRKKGFVETESGEAENFVNNFTPNSSDPFFSMSSDRLSGLLDPARLSSMSVTIVPATTDPYKIKIVRNDTTTVYLSGSVTGTQTITEGTNFSYGYGTYKVYLITEAATITIISVTWNITYDGITSLTFPTSGSFNIASDIPFVISQQIPKIGVIDFLTGLFKMFNLVAEVEEDGTIYVDTLDTYYATIASGGTKRSQDAPYDISEFVDLSSGNVNPALPFSEIDYLYKDTGTILAKKYNELVNKDWGAINYIDDQVPTDRFTGGIYKVEVPFHHAQFERLTDLDTGSQTEIVIGKFIDDNLDPYFGSPLVFYAVRHNITAGYSFVTAVDASNVPTAVSNETFANVPLNTLALSEAASDKSLHFTEELGEYDNVVFEGSLFEDYHKTYIQNVFKLNNRITKVTAYLPLRILLNYTLADRFQIAGRIYKINSIQTNLLTGKSEIELLND
jgi:hypothetical protein